MTCGLGLSAKGLFVIQFSAEIDMWSVGCTDRYF